MGQIQIAATQETGVLATAGTGAARFFAARGGDVEHIFATSGIDPETLSDPTLPISLRSYCSLFETAAAATGDDNIGLWFGQQFKPTDLGLIGYIAVHSCSMRTALQNFVELFPFHQQGTEMKLAERDGLLGLEYRICDGRIVSRRQDAELSLGMFYNIFRHCYGSSWHPEEVLFEHPQPADWREHERAFEAPVFFGQPTNALIFRPEGLERRMPTNDPRLLMLLRRCIRTLGVQPTGPKHLPEQVKDYLLKALPEGCPTLEEASEALQIPPWTIQRRLAEAHITFKELVEETRHELAVAYLRQAHLPLTEIAFLLGYSELSAFSRAFHRWTGVSPRLFRAHGGR
ncbi:MAG: AraC family transcriptional regulator [Betaproteobacteria bacterium]|nr:AraC family transcriptional regulator [Betaproteobacteria bacterium]